jgi:hypothetical protein
MGMKININAVNQVDKGTVIYTNGEEVDSVCLVLKGRVLAVNNGTKVLLGSGSFLGLSDFYMGRFLNSYIAYDDVTFYCFSLEQKDELDGAFLNNKDYKGLAVASLVKYINEIHVIYSNLRLRIGQLFDFVINSYDTYMNLTKKLGYSPNLIPHMDEIEAYNSEFVLDNKKALYYKDLAKLTVEHWKNYCSVGNSIAPYLIEDMSNLVIELSVECNDMTDYIVDLFLCLISNSESCLFKNYASLAISIDEKGGFNNELIHVIDNIVEQINVSEKLFDEKVGQNLIVDRDRMEEIYFMLLSKNNNRNEQVDNNFKYSKNEQDMVAKDLNNTLDQILSYSGVSEEVSTKFRQLLMDYMNLRDKHSIDDSVRALRKRISEVYYEIYENVFFKACNDPNLPKAVDLFLKYGLLDEKFLSTEQLRELYYLDEQIKDKEYCKVYNIKDWLLQIYQGKKEPSKNDFDMDYNDTLRQKRKRGELTEIEEKQLKEDTDNKVSYEIHNMFRYNNRLVNGQISTFIPFLFGDNLIQSIKKLYVSADRVNSAIKDIIDVDYSLFYRESLYVNNEVGIIKEYIMEEYFPDIILMPTVGYNGIMWQEITGKRKSSHGRFLLPQFSDVALKEILIKLCGKFRWELCRSIQGTAWNNIKYKSLTSEYADYIQFYRRNRELSEEVKEKLKLQIQKGKGNYREIFVIDYEAWIKGESTGALRLNRVAREILATYCPFKKELRERLQNQPLFLDAMARCQRNNMKKVKETELRYRALEKDGIQITKELVDTLAFYRDL